MARVGMRPRAANSAKYDGKYLNKPMSAKKELRSMELRQPSLYNERGIRNVAVPLVNNNLSDSSGYRILSNVLSDGDVGIVVRRLQNGNYQNIIGDKLIDMYAHPRMGIARSKPQSNKLFNQMNNFNNTDWVMHGSLVNGMISPSVSIGYSTPVFAKYIDSETWHFFDKTGFVTQSTVANWIPSRLPSIWSTIMSS